MFEQVVVDHYNTLSAYHKIRTRYVLRAITLSVSRKSILAE